LGPHGLLGLQRLILPGYTAYSFTAAASPWPNNAAVADLAHAQGGVVGYVHPFDSDVDPSRDERLTNELVLDAALGKVDYYEAVGGADRAQRRPGRCNGWTGWRRRHSRTRTIGRARSVKRCCATSPRRGRSTNPALT